MSRQSAVGSRIVVLVLSLCTVAALPATEAMTEGPRLAAVYERILDARFEQVDEALRRTCPPAPREACATLAVVSVYWQILLAPDKRELDARFGDLSTAAVAASEAWTKREPQRGEAWFYLAASYAPIAQVNILRGERLAAARDGRRILYALQRALQLDPDLADAYFGMGLYHYYADIAPTALKMLRFLFLLPGGDRVRGLQEMLKARQQGVLLRSEADFQLQQIYLWYERQPAEAVALLRGLDARYSFNPLFLKRRAQAESEYLHDRPASAAAWQTLLDRARERRVYDPGRVEADARIGLAVELDAMDETDRAIDHLMDVLGTESDAAEQGLKARAHLRLGQAYDRLGSRELALKAYAAARDGAPAADGWIRERARQGLRQGPDPRVSDAYRRALEGWRAFERGSFDEALASLARAAELNAADPVARYRYAHVLAARERRMQARSLYETLSAAPASMPRFIVASVYLEYAQLLEDAGERTRAVDLYRSAATATGSTMRPREEARAALKRLGAS